MKDKILEAAERRVRKAGFAQMSFRDLAGDVGIKSASVHYHFATKPDLAAALVERYGAQFKSRLDQIETSNLDAALAAFVDLYDSAFVMGDAICLCAVMGAEANGLTAPVNKKTTAFFEMNRGWLSALLAAHGITQADARASLIIAALEGGMIMASAARDRALFDQIARAALRSVNA